MGQFTKTRLVNTLQVSYNGAMPIEQTVAKAFLQRKKTLSLAESCSGGLLGHRLTNIPGSSKFFLLGVVAYSNEAKEEVLDVPPSLLKRHGAVSEPVARCMAENVRNISQSDFSLSITGIAGPSGGTKHKPVGLVFMAVSGKNFTASQRFLFKGTRVSVKKQAATQALKLLLNHLGE